MKLNRRQGKSWTGPAPRTYYVKSPVGCELTNVVSSIERDYQKLKHEIDLVHFDDLGLLEKLLQNLILSNM
jgi:hypothetical protein